MVKWSEVQKIIREKYLDGVDMGDCSHFMFPYENEETEDIKFITVFKDQEEGGGILVCCTAPIGKLRSRDLPNVLGDLNEMTEGRIVNDGGDYSFEYSLNLEHITEEALEDAVQFVAESAVEFSRKYAG